MDTEFIGLRLFQSVLPVLYKNKVEQELVEAGLLGIEVENSQLAMKRGILYKIATLIGKFPEICWRCYGALLPETLTDCVEFGGTQNTEMRVC